MEKLKLIKIYEKLIFELILFIAPQPMLNFPTPVCIKKNYPDKLPFFILFFIHDIAKCHYTNKIYVQKKGRTVEIIKSDRQNKALSVYEI